MGCYMSAPDNKVYVGQGEGKNFKYATASCQGWRREQEDAEACIPKYDENSSLFILCDGHGGAEVAKYTVEHLPDFIKNHPLYKAGKYAEALERAFIEFDGLLRSEKVLDELAVLALEDQEQKSTQMIELQQDEDKQKNSSEEANAGSSSSTSNTSKQGPSNGPATIVEDVDTDTLRKEAQLPLRQLIEQYSANASGLDRAKRNILLNKYNSSPVVRAKKDDNHEEDDGDTITNGEDQPGPSSSDATPESIKDSLIRQVIEHYFKDDDSSDDSEFNGDDSSNDDGDDEGDDEGLDSSSKKLRKKKHKRQLEYNESSSEDEDEDDSEEDDDEDSEEDEDEDEENDEDEYDEDEEVDADKINADDEEEEEDEEQDFELEDLIKPPGDRGHKPGFDSGCTVVVALVKDNKLYVASAGDSRCIMIMRDGKCKPMSFDHKPEDPAERRRINRAGGRVTDGRVNGGLNLSRAMGDFTYKNPALDPKDQMITACPDVRVAELDPSNVEYIFLACDGIWNSMKNIQTTRFILQTAQNHDDLVDICVKLFRHCIAPRTDGDGTGCDNMTCIIAKFNGDDDVNKQAEDVTKCDLKTEQVKSGAITDETANSQKRSTINEVSDNMPNKRRCLEL